MLFGDSGTGKSFAVPGAPDYPGVYFKKAGDPYFGGYAGERTIVLDDFRGNWFTFSTLLQLLDSTVPGSIKCYGDEVPNQAESIYITSNVSPELWYKDRQPQELQALFRRFDELIELRGFHDPLKPNSGVVKTNHTPLQYLKNKRPFG